MKNLAIQNRGEMTLGHFTLTKSGLLINGEPTFREWELVGEFIQRASYSASLWLGDWLNYGEAKYGEKYAQAIEETPLVYQSLRNISWVARKVPPAVRREELPFSHHAEVAALDGELQTLFLDKAVEHGWTRTELRAQVKNYRRLKGIIGLSDIELSNDTVKLINADFDTNGGQIGTFQLVLWEMNSELHTDHAQIAHLFSSIYKVVDDGGIIVIFLSPGVVSSAVQALSSIDLPVWQCAVNRESEIIVSKNVLNTYSTALVYRKHPKRSFAQTVRDFSTQRTLIDSLAVEATRVLIYRPEDTFIPQMINKKQLVILEPSPKYYELLRGVL